MTVRPESETMQYVTGLCAKCGGNLLQTLGHHCRTEKAMKVPLWVQGLYNVHRNTCERAHGTDFGLCSDCATRAIMAAAEVERDLKKRRRRKEQLALR